MARGVSNVYHVIAPKEPGISREFSDLIACKRQEICGIEKDEFIKLLEEKNAVNEKFIECILKICYPSKDLEFKLIKFPIPKLPNNIRREISQNL